MILRDPNYKCLQIAKVIVTGLGGYSTSKCCGGTLSLGCAEASPASCWKRCPRLGSKACSKRTRSPASSGWTLRHSNSKRVASFLQLSRVKVGNPCALRLLVYLKTSVSKTLSFWKKNGQSSDSCARKKFLQATPRVLKRRVHRAPLSPTPSEVAVTIPFHNTALVAKKSKALVTAQLQFRHDIAIP